jgi:Ca-activated chloride channel family protein
MTRILAYGVAALSLVAVTRAAGLQQPVFRGVADLVRVFVTVTDRDGRIVTSLSEKDFEVKDEGKIQPIAVFDNTPQPIKLVVMLDVSGSMSGNLPLLRAGTEQLFPRLLEDDLARVGTFGHTVSISPTFTRDPRELRAALPERIAFDAPTPLWRAVDEAMDTFKEEGDQRRVILVLSDGKDSGPVAFNQRWVSQAEVIDRARKDDVMVYGIGMRSTTRPSAVGGGLSAMLMSDLPDPGLAQVALQTGGGYTEIRAGQDLGAAFAQIADELHSQYLVGYEPPRRDGKAHKIEVRVLQRGMTPRARKSYIAPKDTP